MLKNFNKKKRQAIASQEKRLIKVGGGRKKA